MPDAAVYFETKPFLTIYHTWPSIVLIGFSSFNNRQMTVCVSVASNGTKLAVFLIFKAQQNGRVENI